jgi:DNA invertase Pin-like site-specific DNA recombinase
LEQEFNSLHAQREACEAYIRSQRHEGWSCLPQAYDDGGRSGGNLERPALQQLLAEIREGKVDVVVVYKIDRLTRSLQRIDMRPDQVIIHLRPRRLAALLAENLALTMLARDGIAAIWLLHLSAARVYREGHKAAAAGTAR